MMPEAIQSMPVWTKWMLIGGAYVFILAVVWAFFAGADDDDD